MPSRITTTFLPDLLAGRQIDRTRTTAVVIDILRASTTIVTALAQGARAVWPCVEIEQAERLRGQMTDSILGGERGGKPIEGFDCSNSPADYSQARVDGRPVVFTTTNGTWALSHVTDCRQVVIGAFVNFSAVCQVLQKTDEIVLVCAGTNRRITREDVLFAGAVVHRLANDTAGLELDDESLIARAAWEPFACRGNSLQEDLTATLRDTLGGRNLVQLGYEADLSRASDVDRFQIAPQWRPATGTLEVP